MNAVGIQPDIIIARSIVPIDEPRKKKLAVFCNVREKDIISAPDIKSIYEVPINFEKDRISERILEKVGLKTKKKDLGAWRGLVGRIKRISKPVKIAIVGKYFGTGAFTLSDSYISVIEAVKHAAWSVGRKPEISWLDAETYEKKPSSLKELKSYQGIIVPGGFGNRGVEGKIKAIEFCRKNKIPFLGLCYGMQLAVIEFARHVCAMKGAHTTEISPRTKYSVIHTMPEQLVNIRERRMGGSMRLGAYKCVLSPRTRAFAAYGTRRISERHRHRYELNNEYRARLEKRGMVISGVNPERSLAEIVELPDHPFFVGTQFHPEFKSRPLDPHPLYRAFIRAAAKY